MGLKKALSSPNGAMRKGWNGITISRDTIHIPGIELGFKHPVLFDRHAVGGEYGAGWKPVGAGKLVTTFFPDDNRWGPCHAPVITHRKSRSQVRSIINDDLAKHSSLAIDHEGPLLNVALAAFSPLSLPIDRW